MSSFCDSLATANAGMLEARDKLQFQLKMLGRCHKRGGGKRKRKSDTPEPPGFETNLLVLFPNVEAADDEEEEDEEGEVKEEAATVKAAEVTDTTDMKEAVVAKLAVAPEAQASPVVGAEGVGGVGVEADAGAGAGEGGGVENASAVGVEAAPMEGVESGAEGASMPPPTPMDEMVPGRLSDVPTPLPPLGRLSDVPTPQGFVQLSPWTEAASSGADGTGGGSGGRVGQGGGGGVAAASSSHHKSPPLFPHTHTKKYGAAR